MKTVFVAGAGGFIGHHLSKRLKSMGCFVIGADIKHPEYEDTHCDEFHISDLREEENVRIKKKKGIEKKEGDK